MSHAPCMQPLVSLTRSSHCHPERTPACQFILISKCCPFARASDLDTIRGEFGNPFPPPLFYIYPPLPSHNPFVRICTSSQNQITQRTPLHMVTIPSPLPRWTPFLPAQNSPRAPSSDEPSPQVRNYLLPPSLP
jgi:hypothetical protein